MPWCPKCKNEYYDTVKICPDCNEALVDSLEELEDAQKKAALAEQKLEDLYGYVQMNEAVSEALEEDEALASDAEDSEAVSIDAPIPEEVQAAALAAAKEAAKQTRTYRYRNNEEKAEDNKSSAYTLLGVGFAGAIADLLFVLGVIDVHLSPASKWMICGVMGVMFLLFIVMGFVSLSNAKKFHEKAVTEKDLTKDINAWCEQNLSAEAIDEGLFSAQEAEELNDELKYFKRFEKMKTQIGMNFLNLDEGYLDRFVDDYYSKLFDEH